MIHTESSSHQQTRTLNPKSIPLLQGLWLILVLPAVILTIINTLEYIPYVLNLYQSSTAIRDSIIDPYLLVTVVFVSDIVVIAVYWGIGSLIFWRRSNTFIAYNASLTLMLVAPTILTAVMFNATTSASFAPVAIFYGIVTNISVLGNVYLLPDGYFKPRWTVIPFILSAIYTIVWFLTNETWPQGWSLATRIIVFLTPIITLQIIRYHKYSTPLERQQTKWSLFGILTTTIIFFLFELIPIFAPIFEQGNAGRPYFILITFPLRGLAYLTIPMGLGVAIFHYRLWDIDLTINRSLVYGTVTLILGIIALGLFILLHTVLNAILPVSPVIAGAIAALGSIGLFNPTRRYVRQIIDRRVYGLRFDLNELRASAKKATTHEVGIYSGKKLGEIELLGVVGRGGMGEIYHGISPQGEVAVKVLPLQLIDDETSRSRFLREVNATSALKHPNIVQVRGSGQDGNLLYLVLDYLDGQDLRSYLKTHGALSLEQALPIIHAIAQAIDYAHGQNIIHRDLKPANIMLRTLPNGQLEPILMDFGLARLAETTTSLTGSGAIGTIDYMSPEQIKEARTVDQRTDIYSLGILTYEMLCGEVPFKGGVANVLFAHLQQPPPDIRTLKPDLPKHITKAIQQAMAKTVEERQPTAIEFWQQLTG